MKILKISISKSQVRVKNGKDLLLVTNNNINAYNKLWNVLPGQEADKYILSHWGTLILKLGSLKDSKPTVQEFYGESKSDRDALCWVFNHLDLPYFAKYRPSIHEFLVYADFGKGKEEGRLSLS